MDRMIGDRWGPNSLEGAVLGVSKDLPPGSCLTQLHCPAGHVLVGASTDRSDFYHQFLVSSSCAASNCVGPALPLSSFSGTRALQDALQTAIDQRGLAGPPAGFLGADPLAYGAFGSLFQGDHAGVEYATQAHSSLLESRHLLDPSTRLVASRPAPPGKTHDALVIDDYFAVSAEPLSLVEGIPRTDLDSALQMSSASRCIATAKEAYSSAKLKGLMQRTTWVPCASLLRGPRLTLRLKPAALARSRLPSSRRPQWHH